MPYGITRCHVPLGSGDFPQLKLVLNLAALEGCKAELTWMMIISQDSLRAKDGYQGCRTIKNFNRD